MKRSKFSLVNDQARLLSACATLQTLCLKLALLAVAVCSVPSCVVNPVPTPLSTNLGGGGAGENAFADRGDATSSTDSAKTQSADAGGMSPNEGKLDSGSAADAKASAGDAAATEVSAAGDSTVAETSTEKSDDASAAADVVGNTGLSQAGAQDFGLFRKILEAGGIPLPAALDDLGFFAEHKLDYPDPLCGQDMCMHALLGIMGNMITGSTCTLVQIGLNTPIQVEKLKRPPLDIVIAIDTSGSMQGEALAYVQQGLQQMLDHLQPKDTVSLVAFADTATVLAKGKPLADKAAIEKAILQLKASGQTDLFGGLFTAFQIAAGQQVQGREARVVLLSDGAATTGLQAPAKLVTLAASYAKKGIGLTTIGVNKTASAAVLADLAEVGAGQFYFLDKPAAVKEVFTEEVKTFLVPIALDVQIKVKVGGGYVLAATYGTHGWQGGSDGGIISIPTLFLAGRMEAGEPLPGTGEGRRGGGGAILLELVPLPGVQDKGVTQLELTWKHPVTGKIISQNVAVDGPIVPGSAIPDGGVFTHPTVEKGFVMLNILAAFQMACGLALDNDPGAAQGVLLALQGEVGKWLKKQAKPDPDIADDMKYLTMFLTNLQKAKDQTPISKPPEPWPKD